MLSVLNDPRFRKLFCAQVLSLVGTGLMTVALSLLAYELSGADAGVVIGTILAIKMVAYVGFAPIGGALAARFAARPFLVGLDVARLCLILLMPLVGAVWQIYLIVFAFQLCSAAFTPAFQSLIPEVLPEEERYTSALALSRLAYNLESLLSPLLAGLLLGFIDARLLFVGTALGLAGSAAFVFSTPLPARTADQVAQPFLRRLGRGFSIYAHTPRLRALFALGFAVSCTGAWVLVNSVVYAHAALGGNQRTYTALLAAYGLGSMLTALGLRPLLARIDPRTAMSAGALLLGLAPMSALAGPSLAGAVALWAVLGGATALVLTPGGLILKRSASSADRPALFATQFSLSHAGWLVTYPLAGYLGTRLGLEASFAVMACGALAAATAALLLWPADDPIERTHSHPAHVHDHAHVHDMHHDHAHEGWEGPEPHAHAHRHRAIRHRHAFVIDDHHPVWNM